MSSAAQHQLSGDFYALQGGMKKTIGIFVNVFRVKTLAHERTSKATEWQASCGLQFDVLDAWS
jgi:hypothetical protein